MISRSPVGRRYDDTLGRESAYEVLQKRAQVEDEQEAEEERRAVEEKAQKKKSRPTGSRRQSAGEALLKSAARAIGSQVGRQIIRGIMGSIFGKR